MHVCWSGEWSPALEAAAVEPGEDVVCKLGSGSMPISQLIAAFIEVLEEEFDGSTALGVLLHLCGSALRVVCRVDLKLLAESAFQLKAEFELVCRIRVLLSNSPEARVRAGPAMSSYAVIGKAQVRSFVVD